MHKENGGHGSGVNKRTLSWQTVFIKVVDSDDWFDKESYQASCQAKAFTGEHLGSDYA